MDMRPRGAGKGGAAPQRPEEIAVKLHGAGSRYANVTSTLALVVALGGTSYAAATITSRDIKDGQVKSKDLGRNAVSSTKVKDRSLLAKDFKPGQLPAGGKGDRGSAGATGATGAQGAQGAQGIQGAPGAASLPVTVTDRGLESTFSTVNFQDIPSIQQIVTVPAGSQRRVIATFSAESRCRGDGETFCTVRILVDGVELLPATSADFAFDSSNGGAEDDFSWESHSFQRHSPNLPAGPHTVTVEARASSGADLRLDEMVLTTLIVDPVP